MQGIKFILAATFFFLFSANPVQADTPETGSKQSEKAKNVLEKLEEHYGAKNFTASFRQESVLPAMDITDTATGRVWFMHPGKMRWEYQQPEAYLIVTDAENLWIHRPADHQVVVGKASEFFEGGRGAGFLADFSLIKNSFETSLAETSLQHWILKLVPKKKRDDLRLITMEVDRQNLEIKQISTENIYGDITRIFFGELKFVPDMEKELFEFTIPEKTDVIKMTGNGEK
jgi:outer membrane lipoprotein carrier protein